MFVRVLGSAAGGAFPQWNCCCRNCSRLRQGVFPGTARSQTQLAISANGDSWFLINASPDLRCQIASFPELNPRHTSSRESPIRASPIHAVLLTSAELDAAVGLLLLRESQPMAVYATNGVRRLLVEDNSMFGVLRRQPDQIRWRSIDPGHTFDLRTLQDEPTGIRCTPIATGGGFPGYVSSERAAELDAKDAVVGLFIEHGSRQIAFFPGALTLHPQWLERMATCDAIFFDGTFWSDDELIHAQKTGKTARQMGHLPVGDGQGSLRQFSALSAPRKIFIHINNTNPMLDEEGDEYRQVRAAGWELATDGMELTL